MIDHWFAWLCSFGCRERVSPARAPFCARESAGPRSSLRPLAPTLCAPLIAPEPPEAAPPRHSA